MRHMWHLVAVLETLVKTIFYQPCYLIIATCLFINLEKNLTSNRKRTSQIKFKVLNLGTTELYRETKSLIANILTYLPRLLLRKLKNVLQSLKLEQNLLISLKKYPINKQIPTNTKQNNFLCFYKINLYQSVPLMKESIIICVF